MGSKNDLKIAKILIMQKKDDEQIYTVADIEYCMQIENGEYELLTGDFAGFKMLNYDDSYVEDNSLCVDIQDLESIKKIVPTDDLDEIRDTMDELLLGKQYILNQETKQLEPYNFNFFTEDYVAPEEDTKEEVSKNEKPIIKHKKQKTISQIDKDIRKTIVGQDDAVRKIVAAVYANQKIINSNLSIEQKAQLKRNILIVGKTGTGKTEIIKQLAKNLDIPYVIEDATRYTKAGYVGENVETMLINLIQRADGNIEAAQKGILVVDEIDKKGSNGRKDDVGTNDVQYSLLKIIEGGLINIKDNKHDNYILFDTSMLTVIFSGAFTEMHDMKEKNKPTHLGFNNTKSLKEERKEFVPEDFIKFGMVPELMGRVSTVVSMNDLGVEDYKTIIKKSKLSPIVLKRIFFKTQNVSLRMEDAFVTAVAEETMKLKMGARGIKIVLDKLLGDIDFDVLEGNLSQVRLNKDKIVRIKKEDSKK